MGLNSGPVYRLADISEDLNVSGSGINFAQRVMDSGDAGHVLCSGGIAGYLMAFGDWKPRLSDLGEHEVKHGEKIRLYNLVDGRLGNPVRAGRTKLTVLRAGELTGST